MAKMKRCPLDIRVQVATIGEYFLCGASWKGQQSGEWCQCICMGIVLSQYLVNVEAFKLLCHDIGHVLIEYQIFMSEFALPANLVDDEFWITICLEIFDSNLFNKLHPDQKSVVLWDIYGTRLH